MSPMTDPWCVVHYNPHSIDLNALIIRQPVVYKRKNIIQQTLNHFYPEETIITINYYRRTNEHKETLVLYNFKFITIYYYFFFFYT